MKVRDFLMASVVVLVIVWGASFAAQITNYNQDFSLSESGTLYVELGMGDIEVTAGPGRVTVVGLDQRNVQDLDVRQEGPDLHVTFKPRDSYSGDLLFEINVPTTFNLDLRTAGGDVEVLSDFLGDIRSKTAGGDIVLGTIQGQVHAKTAGGDIEVGSVGANAELSTAGGDIEVVSVDGYLKASTAGGDIEIGDIGGEAEATTAGGDVELGSVGGAVRAKTAGGDVVVGNVQGSAELKTAGGDIVLHGASGEVEAATSGGDLNLQNVSGFISGKTSGGDIEAELDITGPSELKTAGGDIQVKLAAGASVEARINISGNWERNSTRYNIYENGSPVGSPNPSAKEIVYRSGSGPVLTLETSNGNIKIDQ